MVKDRIRSVSAALAALLAAGAWAGDLPRALPQEVGLSAERLAYIDKFYTDKVDKGEIAGIVTLIARHGKIAHFSAVGYADVEKKRRLQTDTVFRIYSMTKPIASTALMMLYQEGRFQMSDPLAKHLPEFASLRVLRAPDAALNDTVPLQRAPTVQDVLRHTAGFGHGIKKDAVNTEYVKANVFGVDVSLAEMMGALAKIPLLHQPGTTFEYSVSPDVQARLVEVLSGMSFDEFLRTRLFERLSMKDSGFWLTPTRAARLSTAHWSKEGKLMPLDVAHGFPSNGVFLYEPWSVNSYTVDHKRKGGSYGLLSTAEDYWRFAQMLANGGELDGIRILAPQVVRYITRDHMDSIDMANPDGRARGFGFGLGVAVVKDPAAAGYMSSEGAFFWSGAAATYFCIDPKQDMVVVAMTQHLGVPAIGPWSLQAEIQTLVYSALVN